VKASVFIATSVDGFIARSNGDIDWLPEGGGEPHGYDEFIATVDAIVIGRKTFETVLSFDTWPYDGKRVVILSSSPIDASRFPDAVIERMDGPPAQIAARLESSGVRHARIPACGSHSTSCDHACARASGRRRSSFWRAAARCATPSHRDAALSERFSSERVPRSVSGRELLPASIKWMSRVAYFVRNQLVTCQDLL
jgi:hypothetical protein